MSASEIILGVSGGVAAFKSASLASQLVQNGLGVTVVMTPAAEQFIGQATFAAITGRPVASRVFDPSYPLGAHIEIAQRGHLLCVAPATADFLARTAWGMGDDLLATLYLCFHGPVFMAPSMNCLMWDKPAVQRNVERLRNDGVHFIDPEEGWLSCRTKGAGRMAAPETIAAILRQSLG